MSVSRKAPSFGDAAFKQEIHDFTQHLELALGLDIDGDGMEGQDERTRAHGVLPQAKPSARRPQSEAEVEEAEAWLRRVKAVEEDVEATRAAERQAKQAIPTAKNHDRIRRNAAAPVRESEELAAYPSAVQRTVETRPHARITSKSDGRLFITLQNLADTVKKSAKIAREQTQGGMAVDDLKEAMKEVHTFQVRSFAVGGQVQFVKAFAPKIFAKLRNHFGMSYEAYTRLANLVVEGIWRSGDFFFSSKAPVCYRRISDGEHKTIMELLLEYDRHLLAHPYTLMPHWYGLYSIDGLHFVACNNVFHTIDSIEVLYDLRGPAPPAKLQDHAGSQYLVPIGTTVDRQGVRSFRMLSPKLDP